MSSGESARYKNRPNKETSEIREENIVKSEIESFCCPICLNDIQNIDNAATLISCQHVFCFECIEPWLKSKNPCPLCKSPHTGLIRRSGDDDFVVWRLFHGDEEIIPLDDTNMPPNIDLAMNKHRILINSLNNTKSKSTNKNIDEVKIILS
jgi:hypothetical protein